MTRRLRGLGEGLLVVAGLSLVPAALLSALHATVDAGLVPLVDALVACAAVAWSLVVWNLVRTVHAALRVGPSSVEPGPFGWAAVRVASLVLLLAPMLSHHSAPSARRGSASGAHAAASGSGAPDLAVPRSFVLAPPGSFAPRVVESDGHPRVEHRRGGHRGGGHAAAPSSLLVALAADLRRLRRSRSRVELDGDDAVDAETELLRVPGTGPHLVVTLRAIAATGALAGPIELILGEEGVRRADGRAVPSVLSVQRDLAGVLLVLGSDREGTHVLFAPRGSTVRLDGERAPELVDDALRVAAATGLGAVVPATPGTLLERLALREDGELVVCVGPGAAPRFLERAVEILFDQGPLAIASVGVDTVVLADGRRLRRERLSPAVRQLLDGTHDRPATAVDAAVQRTVEEAGADDGVVVRLLTPVPRVDGLAAALEPSRERRAVELLAYLALRAGQPVTGERLRVRVLGTPSADAAAKTLFNVASSLRRALGEGALGPRLPPAGRSGRYAVGPDVRCDVGILHARLARAARCVDPDEKMAWLRGALELVEAEPFAAVLEGYDWFLTEGHLARLQTACEDAACELAGLAVARGLVPLARLALERALLVDPYSERLAAMAMRVEEAAQASFEAMAPALRSTEPSAPTLR